jgi:hypothetical protein
LSGQDKSSSGCVSKVLLLTQSNEICYYACYICITSYNGIILGASGTDVLILKIFLQKKIAKKLAFLTQNKAKLCIFL